MHLLMDDRLTKLANATSLPRRMPPVFTSWASCPSFSLCRCRLLVIECCADEVFSQAYPKVSIALVPLSKKPMGFVISPKHHFHDLTSEQRSLRVLRDSVSSLI